MKFSSPSSFDSKEKNTDKVLSSVNLRPVWFASKNTPVTLQRPLPQDTELFIEKPHLARYNEAADRNNPRGTLGAPFRSVLQQHVDFFDRNKDGIISMWETYTGFRNLGFGIITSLFAVLLINPWLSILTNESYIPDPLFRIDVRNIHLCKYGSDSGVFDTEGRFIPQKFEEIFSKWDKDNDEKLSLADILQLNTDLARAYDFFGWFFSMFRWFLVWLLCANDVGLISREQLRAIYDGSLFYTIEKNRN